MLKSAQVILFLAITDADRSRCFYEDVLGLTFVSDDPFALVFEIDDRVLRLAKVESMTPAPYTVLGWQVADIYLTVENLVAKGVEFQIFAGMDHDHRAVWNSPSGAKVAWFYDPDGNGLSLTQE
jgi:catechol 2,3-dioxygenase-like lactoylglutathione lyase family enzyme